MTLAVWLTSLTLVVLATLVAGLKEPTSFCGIEAKWQDKGGGYICCKSHDKETNRVHIGVCDGSQAGLKLFEGSGGHEAIGYNEFPSTIVTPEEANSDSSANEDNPGKDEGECHVYRVKVQRPRKVSTKPSCIPGNMVMAAQSVHAWLESNWQGLGCSLNLGDNCRGTPDNDKPYDFVIKITKMSSNGPDLSALQDSLQKTDLAIKQYNCDIKEEDDGFYVVCPL